MGKKAGTTIYLARLVISAALLAVLSGCVVDPATSGSDLPRTVTYWVSGTAADADITYANGMGGTTVVPLEERGHLLGELSWEKTVTLPAGVVAWLSAQNRGETGTVAAQIDQEGHKGKRAVSSGAYCIAHVAF